MASSRIIQAGDVWYAVLDPVRGREQAGYRPVIVVSADWYHRIAGAEPFMCVPLTTRDRQFSTHVAITPPEGGIRTPSWAICEQLRAISSERFRKHLGAVDGPTLQRIRAIVQELLTD